MRRVFGMATAGLCVIAMSGSLQAQTLTKVPNNAMVFVRVKNLQEASQKIGGLMQDWGIAAMQPALADPLAAVEGMGNLQQGLNRGGEAALVFINPMSVAQENQGDDLYVLMLPVSDYDAFLKNFEGAEVADGIAEITMPMDGETGYVTKWGAFAAISPVRSLVSERPQASATGGLTGKQLVERDVTAYVNFDAFREQVGGYLGFGRMMAMSQLDQQANASPEQSKYMPVGKAALNQLFNGLEHFMNETQAITFGADFAPEGVKITYMTEFMPDSYLGKLVAQWKSPETTIGGGLPQGQYAIVGTSVTDSQTLLQFVDDAAAPVIEEARKLGPDAKPILDYVDALKDYWRSTRSQNFGLANSQGKPGEVPLFEMVMTMEGDAKGILDAQSRMAALQDEFTKMISQQGQPTSSIKIEKGAATVGGVTFDKMVTTFQESGQATPQAMQSAQMMEMLYGKGGFTMMLGQVDNDTVLATTARDNAEIGKAVTAAKAQASLLANDAGTKQVLGQLPKNPMFAFYVYGDQVMQMASRASEAFAGSPIRVQLPAGTPPMGLTMATEQSAFRMDIYVPSPLVKAISSAALQEAIKEQQQQDQDGDL